MMLAAPTQTIFASPLTIASTLHSKPRPATLGRAVAVDDDVCGHPRQCRWRRIASIVACRDVDSVDLGDSGPAQAIRETAEANLDREFGSARSRSTPLESAIPAIEQRSSRITAAATTGPASGPRPLRRPRPSGRERSSRNRLPRHTARHDCGLAPRPAGRELPFAARARPSRRSVRWISAKAATSSARSFRSSCPEHRGAEHFRTDLFLEKLRHQLAPRQQVRL